MFDQPLEFKTLAPCHECGQVRACAEFEMECDGPHPGCSEFAPPDIWTAMVCEACVDAAIEPTIDAAIASAAKGPRA